MCWPDYNDNYIVPWSTLWITHTLQDTAFVVSFIRLFPCILCWSYRCVQVHENRKHALTYFHHHSTMTSIIITYLSSTHISIKQYKLNDWYWNPSTNIQPNKQQKTKKIALLLTHARRTSHMKRSVRFNRKLPFFLWVFCEQIFRISHKIRFWLLIMTYFGSLSCNIRLSVEWAYVERNTPPHSTWTIYPE